MQWYVVDGKENQGPLSVEEIRAKLRSGELSLDSWVSAVESPLRRALFTVPEFFLNRNESTQTRFAPGSDSEATDGKTVVSKKVSEASALRTATSFSAESSGTTPWLASVSEPPQKVSVVAVAVKKEVKSPVIPQKSLVTPKKSPSARRIESKVQRQPLPLKIKIPDFINVAGYRFSKRDLTLVGSGLLVSFVFLLLLLSVSLRKSVKGGIESKSSVEEVESQYVAVAPQRVEPELVPAVQREIVHVPSPVVTQADPRVKPQVSKPQKRVRQLPKASSKSMSAKRPELPTGWPRPVVNSGQALRQKSFSLVALDRVELSGIPQQCGPCIIKGHLPDGTRLSFSSRNQAPWQLSRATGARTVAVKGFVQDANKAEVIIVVQEVVPR